MVDKKTKTENPATGKTDVQADVPKDVQMKIQPVKVPADQAIDGGGGQKPNDKKSHKAPPKDEDAQTINDEPVWSGIRQNWAKEQKDKATAHFLAVFDSDDEMPASKHILFLAITGFFIIFVLWANWASLEEVTRGDGKIIPSSEIQALQTLDAGIVEEFLVREGAQVEKGQVLMRLNAIEASSDLGANRARYFGLLASITRLQAEAEGKNIVEFPDEVMKASPSSVTEELNAFRANVQQQNGQLNILEQQLQQRESEIREMQMRASDIRGVISLQRQEKEMVEPLVARGSAPKLELLQLERVIKEKSQELNSTTSGLPRARSAVREVNARIKDLKSSYRACSQTN
jgi:adhesin transport system membrane fusion protein